MTDRGLKGHVTVHHRGFGFLKLEDGRVAFIAPPDLNPFLDSDEVTANVAEAPDGRWLARDLKLVHRRRQELYGVVVFHGRKPFLKVDREVSNTDWPLINVPPDMMQSGHRLVGGIESGGVRPARSIDAVASSLERVRVRYGIRTEFPEFSLESEPDFSSRRDLREHVTLTIDAPTSMDLDDALSILPADPTGGIRVLVSIADVDAWVPEGSPLDLEARARGTSVYLAGGMTPMLPAVLSEDRLSLLPDQDRPTLTAELRIDPDGEVTAVDLYESLIRSDTRLSYSQVATFLEQNDASAVPESVQASLRWLRTAAARISMVRQARGGVQMAREEAYLTVDEDSGEPSAVQARPETSAHRLVERLMVAANEAVAEWLSRRGLPAVYRVHAAPTPEQVASLEASARHLGFEVGFGSELSPRGLAAFEAQYRGTHTELAMAQVLSKVLGPAYYTATPLGHFGLGAPLYLHFTSPIRRYADLMVHRVVKRYLHGARDFAGQDQDLEKVALHLNDRTHRAAKAEAERHRMMTARYFAERVGDRFLGHVVAVKSFGLVVQLAGTGVTGTLTPDVLPGEGHRVDLKRQVIEGPAEVYGLGTPMQVVIRGADEALGRIDLEPMERTIR